MKAATRNNGWVGTASSAFTLVELLVVVAMLGLLMLLVFPLVHQAVEAGRSAACAANLRQIQAAYLMYLADHDGQTFPYFEDVPEGRLWYWGLEAGWPSSGEEGERPLDTSRARLAPYYGTESNVRSCPSLKYGGSHFKQKFEIPSMGYGINIRLLANAPGAVRNWRQITRPADLLVWADAAQINTWQPPASPSRPMLEEWYYVSAFSPPKFHFRHGGHMNAAFGDGSVRQLAPGQVDPRCDGRVGFLKAVDAERWLEPN